MTCCFLFFAKKNLFSSGQKSKTKAFVQNLCSEKNNAKTSFLLEGLPALQTTGPVSYQKILTIFLFNGNHLLIAIFDKLFEYY